MDLRNRTLALAGVLQSASLVQQLAHDGRADPDAFTASIQSILMIDAGNTDEVFGGASGVHHGLTLLRDKLGGHDVLDVDLARYVVSLLNLAKQLASRADIQQAIREGILTAERQMKFFEASEEGVHPTLVEKLAELYIQTLGALGPRIMVTGEHGYLVNPAIAAKVRAALLAGVRAAFLWRQLGGRRWQLLIFRRRAAKEAARLLGKASRS